MKNRLTDTQIKKFKLDKTKKLYDGDGLFIRYTPKRISADERKRWQFRYTFDGKEQLLTLGDYPYITIGQARKLKDDAKRLLANGINPSQDRKNEKLKKQATEMMRDTSPPSKMMPNYLIQPSKTFPLLAPQPMRPFLSLALANYPPRALISGCQVKRAKLISSLMIKSGWLASSNRLITKRAWT